MAHAIEAFSLHASHYLVKPFTKEQLEDALDKSIAQVEKDRKSVLVLKTGSGMVKVNLSDFVYSETDKHIQNIQLMDGTCLQIRISCSELFDLLQMDKRFFKCGSTYIINLDKISEVTTKQIMFDSKDQIPMQRRQYKELLERYTSYSFEEN
jgi:DNA-binding LytR/AlgR family response regulator